MKKIIILFIHLLFIGLLKTYASEYSFVKVLGETVQKIIPAQNGCFYTLSTQIDCPDDQIAVRYFDAQGNIQSTFTSPPFIGTLYAMDAVVNTNNNLVLYFKMNDVNHHLYELTSSGTIVWNNNIQFTNPLLTYNKISLAPNGYYLLGNTKIVGGTDSTNAILTKINTIGKHVWTKKYTMNNTLTSSTNLFDMHYENNQLLCVGHYFYPSLATGWKPLRPLVCVLDTAGNVQQSYAFTIDSSMLGFDEYQFVQIEKSSAGNYFMLGYNAGNEHALFKLDAAFNILWIKEKLSGKAWEICAGFNDDVYIVPDYPSNNYVLHFDAAGTKLENHITKMAVGGTNMYGSIHSLEKNECGFLLSNDEKMIAHTDKQMTYCIDSSDTYTVNYYAVTTHVRANAAIAVSSLSSLNEYLLTSTFTTSATSATAICSNTYTCNATTEMSSIALQETQLYPNPASTYLTICLPSLSAAVDIELIDIQGKMVKQMKQVQHQKLYVDMHDLPSGLYWVKIKSMNEVFVQKLRIEK